VGHAEKRWRAELFPKSCRQLHFFELRKRRCYQTIDLGAEYQMVLELRPAHDPTKEYGFAGVVVSLKDLSSSIWLWFKDGDQWEAKKVIEIPAQPAAAEVLPPILKGFGAVPPLLSDINLSVDDQRLYASCWGTGETRQYGVSDPHNPKLIGSIHLGGIVRKTSHPNRPGKAVNGGRRWWN
jgi:selenium-binding protein 1